MSSNLNSNELLKKMEALKLEDVDAFYNVVFNSLLKFPEEAVTDPSPARSKIKALSSILDYFEQGEEYEKCEFIKGLIDQIQ